MWTVNLITHKCPYECVYYMCVSVFLTNNENEWACECVSVWVCVCAWGTLCSVCSEFPGTIGWCSPIWNPLSHYTASAWNGNEQMQINYDAYPKMEITAMSIYKADTSVSCRIRTIGNCFFVIDSVEYLNT